MLLPLSLCLVLCFIDTCAYFDLFHSQLQSKERELSSLAITSVDNFQGQESPIVLLSLVRNNKGTIGFLRTSNRTCVALSRARNGEHLKYEPEIVYLVKSLNAFSKLFF